MIIRTNCRLNSGNSGIIRLANYLLNSENCDPIFTSKFHYDTFALHASLIFACDIFGNLPDVFPVPLTAYIYCILFITHVHKEHI